VPLRSIVVEALEAMPARIDTPILFPLARGYIDIEKFRHACGRRRFAQQASSIGHQGDAAHIRHLAIEAARSNAPISRGSWHERPRA